MKKLTGILIAAALVLAPISASALEMMTDSNMKDVTGQAGVSIAIDDVVIYQESIADTTYWDPDGNTEYEFSTGSMGLEPVGAVDSMYGVEIDYADNTQKLITLDAIVNADTYSHAYLEGEFETDGATALGMTVPDFAGIDNVGASALSIDVGTCNTLTAGKQYNLENIEGVDTTIASNVTVAGVVIGLPTLEIMQFHTNDTRDINITTNAGAAANAQGDTHSTLIRIEKSGTSKMAILGGTVEIAPH